MLRVRFSCWPTALCLLAAIGCVHHRPATSPSITRQADFIELEPGMKVTVVFPLIKSGGYVLPSMKVSGSGPNLTVTTTDDFTGYEEQYYSVHGHASDGVRVRFERADVYENGRKTRRAGETLALFQPHRGNRYIRVVALVRVSKADHNMAIISANDRAALESATAAMTERAQCETTQAALCGWVPVGVAVRPEYPRK